ncbi:MAG: radical SAM protein [Deltaproteobacteria bacterium]|nr:radical SAM protein [Deltaproteobacteria bacterium]
MNFPVKVLIIDPGSNRSEINEPIGIGSISSYLQKYVAHPVIIREHFMQIDGMPAVEALNSANIVGIATRLGSFNHLHAVRSLIMAIPPSNRPLLVLGDLIATYATHELLEIFPEAVCVIGEGEEAMSGLVSAYVRAQLEHTKLPDMLFRLQVPNLTFLRNGKTNFTPRRLLDITGSPAPRRQFAQRIAERGGIIRAEASRGCEWSKCKFCAIKYKYCEIACRRPVQIERIVEELCELSSMGIRSPFYTDEDFVGNDPIWILALTKAIRHAKDNGRIVKQLNFYANARAESIIAPDKNGKPSGRYLFRELRLAGLREVFVGIESGSASQKRRYYKSNKVNDALAAITLLTELGISIDIGFIMFDPEMTIGDLKKNLDFICDANLKTHDARLTKELRVIPKTGLFEKYRTKNLISGPLDINELIYPCRWVNSDAEAVYLAFTSWEKPYLDIMYDLQAKTRGEVPSENIRRRRKRMLGRLRAVDLDVLRTLLDRMEQGSELTTANLDHFRRRRDLLIAEMQPIFR